MNSQTPASPWHKLTALKPSLPRHIEIKRRYYKKELWYLLQDKINGRFHRFSPRAYQLLNLMDGQRSLEQIYRQSQQLPTPDDEQPATQNELVELLQYLHVADLLLCDLPPSTTELFNRKQSKKQQKWQAFFLNPLIWRIPLGNPDKFITPLLPLARFFASTYMAILWCMVVGYALLQTTSHWDQITNSSLKQLMSAQNLLLLWLTYPILKILHEFGHALFTKVWGGQINEYGIVIAMGTPLPYVDATAATAFEKKSQRLMVSAAGMAVELFIAAIALLLWLQIEEGLIRAILFNLMVLGSISTLFFNGNPLLRFDGYHLLCDWFDSPNLGSRASRQLTYLVQYYAFGVRTIHSPAGSFQETFWLTLYAILAFLYRFFILGAIIFLVTDYSPTLGITLGIWLLLLQVAFPLGKKVLFLLNSPELAPNRRRAITITLATTIFLVAFIGFVPLPQNTRAEGILWLPSNARIRIESQGFINKIFVKNGEYIEKGKTLIQLENISLKTRLKVQQATLREYHARYQQVWKEHRSQAALFDEDIKAITAEINYLQQQVEQLTIKSPSAGRFKWQLQNPLGSFVHQGQQIAIISQDSAPKVRVVLTQGEIGLVRSDSHTIEVQLSQQMGYKLNAQLDIQVPAATTTLPSAALGAAGGGRISIDKNNPNGITSQQMIFLLDLLLFSDSELSNPEQHLYGQLAYVRFEHTPEAIGPRIYRIFQQQFLQLASR